LPLAWLLLLIEAYDEVAYGALGAALPAIRLDLHLDYAQVGLLLGVPALLSFAVEGTILLGGDSPHRKRLIAAGGIGLAAAFAAKALAPSLPALLLATTLGYTASGVFVALSQATLVDAHPGQEAHAMARWTLAGSLGATLGPAALAAALNAGVDWRAAMAALAVAGLVLTLGALPARIQPHPAAADLPESESRVASLRGAVSNRRLLTWILLDHVSDLGGDVFTAYLPLYLVDVGGASLAQAALGSAALQASDLVAGALLIPILRRWPPLRVLPWSAAASLLAFAAWLLIPGLAFKLVLLMPIGFARACWYPVLQGEAYASHQGRSAAVSAMGALFGPLGAGLVWAMGATAGLVGIGRAMWLVLVGPLALLLSGYNSGQGEASVSSSRVQ
jgi:FSR family fosmidomycin resistance protein-like MFS transporter